MKREILFATNNEHKLREIREIAGNEFEILGLKDIGFEGDIPETQDTIEAERVAEETRLVEQELDSRRSEKGGDAGSIGKLNVKWIGYESNPRGDPDGVRLLKKAQERRRASLKCGTGNVAVMEWRLKGESGIRTTDGWSGFGTELHSEVKITNAIIRNVQAQFPDQKIVQPEDVTQYIEIIGLYSEFEPCSHCTSDLLDLFPAGERVKVFSSFSYDESVKTQRMDVIRRFFGCE